VGCCCCCCAFAIVVKLAAKRITMIVAAVSTIAVDAETNNRVEVLIIPRMRHSEQTIYKECGYFYNKYLAEDYCLLNNMSFSSNIVVPPTLSHTLNVYVT
jgi:hypothetical protein